MFTGLIEETGTLLSVIRGPRSCVLNIGAAAILQDLRKGDSISVNGVCLTASALTRTFFTADVMPETLDRSNIGGLYPGCHVNLERAMAAGSRFGGHIVSGHIDGTGVISKVVKDDNAVWYTIDSSPSLLRHIIEKGSIAVDGISLTAAQVTGHSFRVSVIPHTAAHTSLHEKKTGSLVNLETDCIGKYVEKLLGLSEEKAPIPSRKVLTKEFLDSYGY